MSDENNTRPSSSPFPIWSLGLLLGFILVVLWKRLMEQQQVQAPYAGASPTKITLEDVGSETPAVPAPEPPPAPVKKDDLRKIEGVGPKVQERLNEAGILTFSQLGRASQKKLKGILEAAGYGYMDPGAWAEQARLAAKGDWEGLAALKANLKGGRAG